MNLRPYQEQAVAGIYRSWQQWRKTLLVLPTGCGKTIVFAHMAAREVEAGNRVLILAHREELVQQAADKLERVTGMIKVRDALIDVRRLQLTEGVNRVQKEKATS
jgi:superfamily II DNA or RNA helicase